MKKALLLGMTLVTALSSLPVQADNLNAGATGSADMFAHNVCVSEGGTVGGHSCVGTFLSQLALTIAEASLVTLPVRELMNRDASVSGMLLNNFNENQTRLTAAREKVIAAQLAPTEQDRSARVSRIRQELAQLENAALEGRQHTINWHEVTTEMTTQQTTVRLASVDNQITRLNSSLAQLQGRNFAAQRRSVIEQIQQQQEIRAEIMQIDRHQLVANASVVEETRVLYAHELQPAIAELQRRLNIVSNLPILNAAEKANRVRVAVSELRALQMTIGRGVLSLYASRAVRIVSAGVGGYMILDATGRALLLIFGRDPSYSPLATLSGAAVGAFRR